MMLRLLGVCLLVLAGLPIPCARAQAVVVPAQLYNGEALAAFLRKLPTAYAVSPPVSIIQIGDSHTAGDMVTNGWRRRWQAEYGSGGRGLMAVGRPYQGYLTWGVTARESADWAVNALFGRQHASDGAPLGLAGFTRTARRAGAWVQLAADSPADQFDRFGLCGLTGPDQGAVRVVFGAQARDYSFAAAAPGAACLDLAAARPEAGASVTTLDDRPVNLTSWAATRQSGGIVLANLGVVGSRLAHFSRNTDAITGVELRASHPDLVVIAFGTNEGFDPALHLDEAEAAIRGQVARIRTLLGYAVPILLLGPPDAASNRAEIALPGLPETVQCGNGWMMPGHLARIRALQLRLANELGLAFWDWQQAMGGACASSAWVEQGLQRGDHVHFTPLGGQVLGEALADDLDQARRGLPR